ncbi:hypothetical protein [Rhodococcus marinonascens]|uniref:hypothetical protein n=1 Tax=Rhodococcus marinonascens TaxID=38311 RepID=UPI000934AAC9|nr:hypothetical protein [Rhodococcus marinonascens]
MSAHEPDSYGYDSYGPATPGDLPAPAPRRSPLVVRAIRALSGAVAAGVVMLLLVVIVSGYIGGGKGVPGPGTVSVTAHVAAAVVVIAAQRIADRREGVVAVTSSVAVFAAAALLLFTQWWD